MIWLQIYELFVQVAQLFCMMIYDCSQHVAKKVPNAPSLNNAY